MLSERARQAESEAIREITKAAPESTSRETVPVQNPRPYSMNDLYSHICREAQKLK